jgi:peptidoglycan/xylan/chitin deacetylase (PgdA/CDA1 family)
MNRQLHVIVYHYVRSGARGRFPRLNAIQPVVFEKQLDGLCARFEMATVSSAVDFLNGAYRPERDLCLLTFDDGLKEHLTYVTPALNRRGLQGVFSVTARCADGALASVHKNHVLAATLNGAEYRAAVATAAERLSPGALERVNETEATQLYRFDTPEAAVTKYLMNFALPRHDRQRIVDELFAAYLGDEEPFARELYLDWNEVRALQHEGMIVAGHSFEHVPLATLGEDQQREEIHGCASALRTHLAAQPIWPFVYPYGSYNGQTCRALQDEGFDLGFGVEAGSCEPGDDVFGLRRFDANDVESALFADERVPGLAVR